MTKIMSVALVFAGLLFAGCSFESSSQRFSPTAPSTTNGPAGSTGSAGGSSAAAAAASAFAGSWGSSTIAGLPLGNCSDVKWLITAQTDTTVAGTVTANCASGVTVAANLAGTLNGSDRINLTATGTLSAMGLPCQFNLSGVGTRGAGETMRVDYTGSYCFGNVSGTENLRKFPV